MRLGGPHSLSEPPGEHKSLHLAIGRTVSTFVIITFFFLLCSGFYPNLPHIFHFSLSLIFFLRFFFQCYLQLTFPFPHILYLFSPSVFFNSPTIHCLLFLYSFIYFSFFIIFFLACFLYACSSHVSKLHTFFPPRDSLVLSQPPSSTS